MPFCQAAAPRAVNRGRWQPAHRHCLPPPL